jgi:hypothetical protein
LIILIILGEEYKLYKYIWSFELKIKEIRVISCPVIQGPTNFKLNSEFPAVPKRAVRTTVWHFLNLK